MNFEEALTTDFQTIEDVTILREAISCLQLQIYLTRKILGENSITTEEVKKNLDLDKINKLIEQQLKQP